MVFRKHSLQGGNVFTIRIGPSGVSRQGTFEKQIQLTGLEPGRFSIVSAVVSGTMPLAHSDAKPRLGKRQSTRRRIHRSRSATATASKRPKCGELAITSSTAQRAGKWINTNSNLPRKGSRTGMITPTPNAFFWVGAIRLVYSLHLQCFVNSITHVLAE